MTIGRTPTVHLQQIEAFCLTARLGSQTQAGRVLGRQQAVVSRQIGALEGALGTRLIQRTGRGVRLTPAGQQVAACCADALALLAHSRLLAAIHAPGDRLQPSHQDRVDDTLQRPPQALTDTLHEIRAALDDVFVLAERGSPGVARHALDATVRRLTELRAAFDAVSEPSHCASDQSVPIAAQSGVTTVEVADRA